MANQDGNAAAANTTGRSRETSLSAIPLPISRSSWRIESLQEISEIPETPLMSPRRARRPRDSQASLNTQISAPPSSFRTLTVPLPRSDSLPLSSQHQQRVNSSRFHSSRCSNPRTPQQARRVAICPSPAPPRSSVSISEPQKLVLLDSPRKDVRSQRLLRPLSPLSKVPTAKLRISDNIQKGAREFGLLHALEESRMTKKEIENLNQSCRRFAQPCVRLEASPYSSARGCGKAMSSSEAKDSFCPAPDVLKTDLKILGSHEGCGNQAIATETARTGMVISEPSKSSSTLQNSYSLAASASDLCQESGDTTAENNARWVFRAEDEVYWLGRFIGTFDHMRNNNGSALQAGCRNHETQIPALSRPDLYNVERSINRVLKELRSFCKSEQALTSFHKFEKTLLNPSKKENSLDNTPFNDKRSSCSESGVHAATTAVRLKTKLQPFPLIASRASRSCSHGTLAHPSASMKLSYEACNPLSMAKSKTTSNLAAVTNFRDHQASREQHTRKDLVQSGQQSKPLVVSETFGKPLPIPRYKLTEKASEAIRKVSEHVLSARTGAASHTGQNASKPSLESLAMLAFSERRTKPTMIHRTDGDPNGSSNTGVSAEANPVKAASALTEILNEKQKVAQGRRLARNSSGDIIKKMMDASVKEVRRMGRRVGSMSLGSEGID